MALWDKQAKRWAYFGAPLRPSAADIQISSAWINEKFKAYEKPLSVLLLGVTPEVVNIIWPRNTTLLAIDNNIAMINGVLPAETSSVKPLALVGDWLQLPLCDSSIDLVIGDGCYTTLAEKNYENITKEIRRVLNPTGMFIMRFFTRPHHNESIVSIQNDFLLGKINNFHVLKWRLAMALHGALDQGVCLKEIWDHWNIHFKKNNRSLMKQLQWSENVIRTIDNYKNANVFYTFPTLQEIRVTLHHHFHERDIYIPSYALGERCPSLKLQPL